MKEKKVNAKRMLRWTFKSISNFQWMFCLLPRDELQKPEWWASLCLRLKCIYISFKIYDWWWSRDSQYADQFWYLTVLYFYNSITKMLPTFQNGSCYLLLSLLLWQTNEILLVYIDLFRCTTVRRIAEL